MASGDGGEQPGASPREGVEDALGRLEERLDRASRAAERLLADAAMRMTEGRGAEGEADSHEADDREADSRKADSRKADSPGAGDAATPPPAGWQQRSAAGDRRSAIPEDADLLWGLFAAVRDRIPPDLQQRLAEAIREVLQALRALIDWYLERTDRTRSRPTAVQDIPIL
jgi:hypothetical protein